MDPETLVGPSGDVAVHLVPSDAGDPRFVLEHVGLGELVDLPDLAAAREIYGLLARAIMLAEIRLILEARIRAMRNGHNV